ncbi:lipocalin-like domain-containing protein [Bosea sp. RAF48]|uniref:lipocalin-like domain-containing protein n=1 Tax=Bosea sp. RAF48 TaxID=3237480 RepID=UPI003F8EBC91
MRSRSLRERLIGAWSLVSYEERPVDGSPSFYPMGTSPKGIIMYTPDGFMSAQLSKPDRKPFSSGDWFQASDTEFRDEASSYIAYTGPFQVDEEREQLTHSMFISLLPNWAGQTQPRLVRIEGDRLFLSTASPISSVGRTVNSYLAWRRADISTMQMSSWRPSLHGISRTCTKHPTPDLRRIDLSLQRVLMTTAQTSGIVRV